MRPTSLCGGVFNARPTGFPSTAKRNSLLASSFRTTSFRHPITSRRWCSTDAKDGIQATLTPPLKASEILAPYISKGYIEINSTPAMSDPSAEIYLAQPPPDHVENKQIATHCGMNQFFHRKTKTKAMKFRSMCTIKFEKHDPSVSIAQYREGKVSKFWDTFPLGTYSTVNLHPSITAQFDKQKLPHDCVLMNTLGDSEQNGTGCFSFFVKTPGGIWDLSWHSTTKILENKTNQITCLVEMLKNISVKLLDQDAAQPSTTAQQSTTAPQLTTKDELLLENTEPTDTAATTNKTE